MTAKEFTYWLRGYLKALKSDAKIEDVISDIMAELEKVDKPELPKADKQAEKLTDDWLREWQKQKQNSTIPINPQAPVVVMYGCWPNEYPTYTINCKKENQ